MSKKFTRKLFIIAIPAIAGFLIMYVYPMLRVAYYSLINNTYHAEFVGLANYAEVLGNRYFLLAMSNTMIFSSVSVFLLLLIAIVLSYFILAAGKRVKRLLACVILPAAIPSAAMIYVWRLCFANSCYDELRRLEFLGNAFEILPVLTLFLWKNTGIAVMIVTAGLLKIPDEISDAARLETSSRAVIFTKILLPQIRPELLFTGMLGFVFSLRIFRESNLYYGTDYPPDAAYTLQYYMNNHFHKLDYQILSAATVLLVLIMTVITVFFYRAEERYIKSVI